MRTNPEHRLRRLGSHYMIVDACADDANLTNVYVLNDTAAFLWQGIEGTEFDSDALVSLLCASYDVDPLRARVDVETMLADWLRLGLVSE